MVEELTLRFLDPSCDLSVQTSFGVVPLANVADRRLVPNRFAPSPKFVCFRNFQCPELRKHSGVGLKPICNVVD